jgi:sterol desaturase/sphingolipid hydroxylase (fatty acid hydroxylase superfamily)
MVTEFLSGISLPTLSLIVIVSSALLMIGLERLFPHTRGQKLFHEGFFSDLFLYTFFQSWVLSFVIFGFINWLDSSSGLSRLQLISGLPVWAQLVFFVITHDLYIYAFHRWQHRNKFLYRIHEAHHSTQEVDWISGSRSHAVEILINQTIEFAPIILLGAAPEVVIYKGMIDAVWGMYIHSNIDVRSGWLQYVINGPEMHRWHHSKSKGNSVNYATKFAFWDWMLGTAYLPETKPTTYGLTIKDYPLSSTNTSFFRRIWDDALSYVYQHTAMFRSFKKPADAVARPVKKAAREESLV